MEQPQSPFLAEIFVNRFETKLKKYPGLKVLILKIVFKN